MVHCKVNHEQEGTKGTNCFIHDPLGLIFHQSEKDNAIAGRLFGLTEINKLPEIEKGLSKLWHSK
jgi:hypothetical protein